MYRIEISRTYGNFATENDAFKEICELATKEAEQSKEFPSVYISVQTKEVTIKYDDNTLCCYKVKEMESEE